MKFKHPKKTHTWVNKKGDKNFQEIFPVFFWGFVFFFLREIPFFFKCFKQDTWWPSQCCCLHPRCGLLVRICTSTVPAAQRMGGPEVCTHGICWRKSPWELRLGPRGSNNKLREQSNNVQKLGKKKRRNVFRGYLCCGVSGDTPLGLQFTWYLLVFFFAFFAFLSMFLRNANRSFDSQNNAASGYQIGDDCKPACKDENNNYDVTVEGATKGAMKFYQGSELYIEWHHQHGCGVGHPNLRCQNLG